MSLYDLSILLLTALCAAGAVFACLPALGLDVRVWNKSDAARLEGQKPTLSRRKYWLVLGIAVLSLILSTISSYRSLHPDYLHWQSTKQEVVYAKSFSNETVEIDGKIFDRCHFTNVSLVFRGFAPPEIKSSDFHGTTKFVSENQIVRQTMMIDNVLIGLTGYAGAFEQDANGNLTPIPGPAPATGPVIKQQ